MDEKSININKFNTGLLKRSNANKLFSINGFDINGKQLMMWQFTNPSELVIGNNRNLKPKSKRNQLIGSPQVFTGCGGSVFN